MGTVVMVVSHDDVLVYTTVIRPDYFFRSADFGRKAFTTDSCVSMYGPPIRSMQ
jgi:hypothetical protein